MRNWLIKLYVRKGEGSSTTYSPCSSEYSMIYDDLKTLWGVKNRMKKWIPFNRMEKEVVGYKIFTYTNLYDVNTYTLMEDSTIYSMDFNIILQKQIENNK